MTWEVEGTDEFAEWYRDLDDEQRDVVTAAIDLLADHGPALRRPVVGDIEGSKLENLKELRVSKGGKLRVLFLFDPRSTAILLVGGDKTGRWNEWYAEAIPTAENLYEEYLKDLRREGLIE